MNIQILQAGVQDLERVSAVLIEAANWLQERGIPMWRAGELSPDRVADVLLGDFFVAEVGEELVGTVKFQLQEKLFWPDLPEDEAAFVHRLAVRRSYAGGCVSGSSLLRWAADRARHFQRRFLRLDCDATRPRLRSVYERFGFRYHSDRQVGPYLVARYEYELENYDRPLRSTKLCGPSQSIDSSS